MQVDIVFTGLCSFLNVCDVNPLMPEPSVILVSTNGHAAQHRHRPYIAFDNTKVTVDPADNLEFVKKTQDQFSFLPFEADLQGVLLTVDTAPQGTPVVHPSYLGKDGVKGVVRRDDYWKEAINQFNPAFVPEKGGKPKKTAVDAFMRFGGGAIWADRLCQVKWIFTKPDGTVIHEGNFPEEVVYSFQNSGDDVVITLTDLDSGDVKRTLHFSLKQAGPQMTLNMGNNIDDDMDNAVQRRVTEKVRDDPGDLDHFTFLNQTAPAGTPPAPLIKLGPQPKDPPGPGGGGLGGACGPNNGNS
jgi:hypothetical protein